MRFTALLFALPLPLTLLSAPRAEACGGLFCAQSSPSPVDQAAERVLFEINDDLSVTATVEVKYSGDPSAFSWIIPVSDTPSFVEVGSAATFQLLDAATRPSIVPPTQDFSNCESMPSFACGPMAAMDMMAVPGGENRGGVDVTRYPNVGPYTDIVLVEGEDPTEVIAFLNDNGYLVTEAMRPIFEEYTQERQRFLAVQLQPNADVKDIVPVKFHCPAPGPVVPLRLTQVAALPEMGILVFIAGPRRYRPANYSELLVPPQDVHFDNQGRSNYFPLVSKMVDELGGLGFVVERAQRSDQIRTLVDNTFLGTDDEQVGRDELTRLLGERPFVTRLYTRISGHEMFLDPVFMESEGGEVNGTLDLSEQVIDVCSGGIGAPPCGLLYCGDVDVCATTNGGDGCRCTASRTARASTAPDGTPTVSCVPADYDFIGGAGMRGCDGVDCGEGLCVAQNGTATCRCNEGAAAIVDTGSLSGVRCVPALESYSSDQILWPEDAPAPVPGGCSGARGNRIGGGLSLALLFGSALLLRLRRRAA